MVGSNVMTNRVDPYCGPVDTEFVADFPEFFRIEILTENHTKMGEHNQLATKYLKSLYGTFKIGHCLLKGSLKNTVEIHDMEQIH